MSSFYYLRIPKTGSTFFKHNLIVPLKSYLQENGIDVLNNGDHEGWGPVKEDTYIISIFRDPIKRTISHFCHEESSKNTLEAFLNQNKTNFFSWLESNQGRVANFQSKNIMYSKLENLRGDGWSTINDPDFINMDINIENLKSRIESISILMNTSSLNHSLLSKVSEKIISDLNLPPKDIVLKNPIEHYVYSFYQNIYNSLSDSEKQQISEINSIDSEIYNTSQYFVLE